MKLLKTEVILTLMSVSNPFIIVLIDDVYVIYPEDVTISMVKISFLRSTTLGLTQTPMQIRRQRKSQ